MESFLIYIGKSSLAAGAFYLLYLALFQNRKQFVFNRIYLPVSMALSFLIPLITFTSIRYIEASPVEYTTYAYLPESAVAPVVPEFQLQWYHYLSALYLLGIAVFVLYLILGHAKALNIVKNSRLTRLFNVKVNVTLKDVHPFSFFNKIVISDKTLENPSLPMIIQHEEIHVRDKHTLDILFSELLFLLQWFNPFAWLIKIAIKDNLEYLTDHEIVKTNNPQAYQLAMLELVHKQDVAPFLTALNGSQLKTRIIMMKKKTENKYALLKQLVVLPLLAILVMGLSNKEVKTEIVQPEKNIAIVVDGKIISKEDPAFKSIDFSKGIDGREIMLALGIEDKVISNGMNIGDNETGTMYFIRTSDYVAGSYPEFDKLISDPEKDKTKADSEKTLYAINGKILSDEEAEKLDAMEFESATILTGDNAVEKYGEIARDASVVDFETGEPNVKVYSNTSEKEVTISGKITDPAGDPISGAAILVKGKPVGTITDPDGNYIIKTDASATLIFTMTGYEKQEIELAGKEKVNVQLEPEKGTKSGEIKVTGYAANNPKPNNYKYKVSGKVTDKKGQPISGAAVTIKGKNIGTITDADGNYVIGLTDGNETLIFTSTGYQARDISVAGADNLDVRLDTDKISGSAGWKLSGGINGVVAANGDDIVITPSSSNGIKISTYGQENNQPLYVVDGKIQASPDYLSPADIESISVLKDQSSTALYGDKGKNGVILITTKGAEQNTISQSERSQVSIGSKAAPESVVKETIYKVTGKVTNENGDPVPGTSVLIEGTTFGTVTDFFGLYEIRYGKPIETLIFKMNGHKTIERKVDSKTEIDVSLKAENKDKGSIQAEPSEKESKSGATIRINSLNINDPLYVVDGKVQPNIEYLNPDGIQSIDVLKGESATSLFGEKGNNGVIIITTKAGVVEKNSKVELKGFKALGDNNPLIILDGEKTDRDINSINPADIASVSVLKDTQAIERYGDEAKDGVVVVTTKDYKVSSELELRKFFARNMRYPVIAQENNQQAVVKVAVRIDMIGQVREILDNLPEEAIPVGEVVVVAYKTNSLEAAATEQANKALGKEVKRVINKLPILDISEFIGKDVVFTVNFVLQEQD